MPNPTHAGYPPEARHRLSVEAGRSYGAIYGRGGTARYRRAIAALARSHHSARRAHAGNGAVA